MAVKLAYNRVEQFLDGSGNPYSGAKLFTYVAGSVNTKQPTYTESTGSIANTNPIVLDANGQPPQPIWLTTGVTYKFVLAPSTDTDPPTSPFPNNSLDNITGINDSSASQSEWISGPAPTFISATSFSLVGDQTQTFQVGRRIKTTNTSGTIYSTIISSVFGAITTVTVVNDSGVLDSGLSAVSYALMSFTNASVRGAWYLLESKTAAASPTLDFNNLTGYAAYQFVISALVPVTNLVELWIRISKDNGATFRATAADYRYANWIVSTDASSGVSVSAADTEILLVAGVANVGTVGGVGTGIVTVANLDNSSGPMDKHFIQEVTNYNGANFIRSTGTGVYVADQGAINGIRFMFSSGNIASGIIKCLGLRAS